MNDERRELTEDEERAFSAAMDAEHDEITVPHYLYAAARMEREVGDMWRSVRDAVNALDALDAGEGK